MIWLFIDAEKANFPIEFMCAEFEVTRQGYYQWRKRTRAGGSRRAVADAELTDRIRVIFFFKRRRYGAPRIRERLAREGVRVAEKRVARLMVERGPVLDAGVSP